MIETARLDTTAEKRLYTIPGAATAIRAEARATIGRLQACRKINAAQRDNLIAKLESLSNSGDEPANIRALDEADNAARKLLRYLEK